MNTETIFYDGKDGKSVFRTKVDLHKGDDNCLQSFRVTMWDRTIECVLSDDEPKISVRMTVETEKEEIRKKGYGNVGKSWSDKDIEDLTNLFNYTEGNIRLISTELERTERSIVFQLEKLGFVD